MESSAPTHLPWRVPFDRQAAERAIREAYRVAGLVAPKLIVWADGPRHAHEMLSDLGPGRWMRWLPFGLFVVAAALEVGAPALGLGPGAEGWGHGADLLVGGAAALSVVAVYAVLLNQPRRSALRHAWAWLYAYTVVLLAAVASRTAVFLAYPATALTGGALVVCHLIRLGDRRRRRNHELGMLGKRGGRVDPLIGRALRRAVAATLPTVGPAVGPMVGLSAGLGPAGLGPAVSASTSRASRLFLPFDEAARVYDIADALSILLRGALLPAGLLMRRLESASTAVAKTGMAPERQASALAAAQALLAHVDGLWAFAWVAVASRPPIEAHFNERGRLHNASGPAAVWADGSELFAAEGEVAGNIEIMLEPERMTLADIRAESAPTVRRVLMERYGIERLMRETRARRVAGDAAGELWRVRDFDEDEALMMVRVINSTPEPDGSCRVYWLRVPPTMRTAREAVAWTFGFDERLYAPRRQT